MTSMARIFHFEKRRRAQDGGWISASIYIFLPRFNYG